MWAFGVNEAGCYGIIDVKTDASYLFVPRYPQEYAVWMGPLKEPYEYIPKYGIANVCYVDQLNTILERLNPDKILTLKGGLFEKNGMRMYLFMIF